MTRRRNAKCMGSFTGLLMRAPLAWQSICVKNEENYRVICPMLFMAQTRCARVLSVPGDPISRVATIEVENET